MSNQIMLKNGVKAFNRVILRGKLINSCLRRKADDEAFYIKDPHEFEEFSKELLNELNENEKKIKEQYGYMLY